MRVTRPSPAKIPIQTGWSETNHQTAPTIQQILRLVSIPPTAKATLHGAIAHRLPSTAPTQRLLVSRRASRNRKAQVAESAKALTTIAYQGKSSPRRTKLIAAIRTV